MTIMMVNVNDWSKYNLSGRRVVVSISSTSDKSCLWKPGLIILVEEREVVILQGLHFILQEKPAHDGDIDPVKEGARLLSSPSRHRLPLTKHILQIWVGNWRRDRNEENGRRRDGGQEAPVQGAVGEVGDAHQSSLFSSAQQKLVSCFPSCSSLHREDQIHRVTASSNVFPPLITNPLSALFTLENENSFNSAPTTICCSLRKIG